MSFKSCGPTLTQGAWSVISCFFLALVVWIYIAWIFLAKCYATTHEQCSTNTTIFYANCCLRFRKGPACQEIFFVEFRGNIGEHKGAVRLRQAGKARNKIVQLSPLLRNVARVFCTHLVTFIGSLPRQMFNDRWCCIHCTSFLKHIVQCYSSSQVCMCPATPFNLWRSTLTQNTSCVFFPALFQHWCVFTQHSFL